MIWDVMIIGGGPAGMTAGIYAMRAGLSALLLENEFVGGQASTTDVLGNYPGFPEGVGGPELMMKFEEQASSLGLEIAYEGVTELKLAGEIKHVYTQSRMLEARSVILCMGAKRRKLNVPGEEEFIGRGVSYCATCDGALYRGKSVAVIGGGNTAAEDALYLAAQSKVTLIHRRDELRAESHQAELIYNHSGIEKLWDTVVLAIEKAESGLTVRVKNLKTGEVTSRTFAACFVAVGTEPSSILVRNQLNLDAEGYIVANEDTQTTLSGVFAAGDIRTKPLKQVVTAVADGAVAATMAARYLHAQKV